MRAAPIDIETGGPGGRSGAPSGDTVTVAPSLPEIAVAGRASGPRPLRLLRTGTFLLEDVAPDRLTPLSLAEHRAGWGPQPLLDLTTLAEKAAMAGVVGAGGAGFPTDRKLLAMTGRRVGVVIVNGCEGETTSAKDGVLLSHVPHLVLDGAVAAAHALGAGLVVVRVDDDRPWLLAPIRRAIAERDGEQTRFELSVGPGRFVAGEATAVIRSFAGGPAAPAALGLPPRLPGRGLRPRPHVFLSNTETFARLAAASRGQRGTSSLATVSGAVSSPGVVELPDDATLGRLAVEAGVVGSPSFLITGGWHGAWLRWPATAHARLNREGLAGVGGRWGAGAFVWLPEDLDPREALAAIVAELAQASAGQCGPCVRGLPGLADALERARGSRQMTPEVERLLAAVDSRGLCAHPSATAAAVRSAWRAIEAGG